MPDPLEPASLAGEALFLQFVQTVQDHAIFVMDPQARILYWNAGAEHIMGFSASDVIGRELHDIFTPEDRQGGIPQMELDTALRVGRAADERWHVRKDGSRFWGLGAVTPIRASDGALLGFGKIVADRTDLKELQDALRSRSEALAHADDLKNRFLATLAHELRNPQAVLANSAGVLRRHAASAGPLQTVADMIDRQVHQMQRLIEDLSDLARSARGRIQLRLEQLDLRDIARMAGEAVHSAMTERRHALTFAASDLPVPVDVDADRLQQVMINLLLNAARYTPPGGRISFTVAVEGAEAVTRVQDTGVGIPPDRLAEIFELFTQVHPDHLESRAGMGIGLALARELVTLHGGTIQARSEGPGRGSEFIVRLPLKTGEARGKIEP
jgi:PAS domain S-box-containing protein